MLSLPLRIGIWERMEMASDIFFLFFAMKFSFAIMVVEMVPMDKVVCVGPIRM